MSKSSSKSAKTAASVETSESIDEQIQQFLKAGGKIQQISSGVSGQQDGKGPKHITLGKPNAQQS